MYAVFASNLDDMKGTKSMVVVVGSSYYLMLSKVLCPYHYFLGLGNAYHGHT